MLACSLANNAFVSDNTRPISASVLTTTGRLNVTSSVVVTSPSLVLASSRTVHCITPAVLMPGISHADQPAKGKQAAPGF